MEKQIDNKSQWIFLLSIAACLASCCRVDDRMHPLVSVISMISAEALSDTVEAEKYIYVDSVYAINRNQDIRLARKQWVSQVIFNSSLGKDTKFTNIFKYYNYDITECIRTDRAQVIFKSKAEDASLKSITYSLSFKDGKWKISSIIYKK